MRRSFFDWYRSNVSTSRKSRKAKGRQQATRSRRSMIESLEPRLTLSSYYIATTGSDTTGTGTFAAPWKTFNKGVSSIASGDTLYARGGTYTSGISSGNCVDGITVQNYGTETVTVNGSLYFNGDSNVVIRGSDIGKFIIYTTRAAGYYGVRFEVDPSTNITLENLEIKNCGMGILTSANTTYLAVRGCKIYYNGVTNLDHGIYHSGDYSTFENNEVYSNSGYGIHLYSQSGSVDHNIVRGNRIRNNGTAGAAAGVIIDGSDNQIYNNLIYNNNADGIILGYGPSNDNLIYHNTIYSNDGQGIRVGSIGGPVGTIIKNNIISDNSGTGVLIYYPSSPPSGTVVQYNLFYNDAIDDQGTGSTISNNTTGNPLYVSTTTSSADFLKIQSSSPARNGGTNPDPGITISTDYWGESRPQGDYDIGADEYPESSPPATPANFGATSASASQINLSWSDVTGETAYWIDRQVGTAWTTNFASRSSNVTTYSDSSLTEGSTYSYRVRAYNANGYSGYTGTETQTTWPATPGTLGATVASSTQINLSWGDLSTKETGYEIDRKVGSTGTWATITTLGSNFTTFNNTGLTSGTTYYYRVRATISGTNDSANSNEVNATPSGGSGSLTVYSVGGTEDGYVKESNETSDVGNTISTNYMYVGDYAANEQLKGIISFDTSALPDNATITSATLRLRLESVKYGTNPFTTHGTHWVDIKGGSGFGGSTALATGDFQAAADATHVAQMPSVSTAGDYSEDALDSGLSYVNTTGKTQFRLYFNLDDNNDSDADCLNWYKGTDGTEANKPQLIINYTTPMMAEGGEMVGRDVADLTMRDLRPVVAEARQQWRVASGEAALTLALSRREMGRLLANVHFAIADLPGATLGMVVGRTVYIDTDAAGYGWAADSAFADGEDYSTPREGVGMDLLTVVSHELGHVMGLGHSASGVMSETLAEGVRKLPAASSLNGQAVAAALSLLEADDAEEDLLLSV